MFLKSKMIRDPRKTNSLWDKRGNLMGLTRGFTIHTNKYVECEPDRWLASQFDHMGYPKPLSEKMKAERYEMWYYHMYECNVSRHLSYRGYAYFTGPKRRYTFRYAGPTWTGEVWWKPFSVRKHNQYTRWFDNGPQNPPQPQATPEIEARVREALQASGKEMMVAMESARQQMKEYIDARAAK